MTNFDPLNIGTTTFRPVILTKELHPGHEVTLLRKRAIGMSYREGYDNEATFLEKATRKGIIGVPRLFRYNPDNLEIEMEYVRGQQYAYYAGFGTGEGSLKYPDDLEIQIKFLPLYVRTIDNVRSNTGMIKTADNKAVDAIIVNRALDGFGDLVIIDWRWAEPVTDHKLRMGLADACNSFMEFPPNNVQPSRSSYYDRVYMNSLSHYLSTKDRFPLTGPRELQSSAILEETSKEIRQWLEVAPETPYKRMVKSLFQNTHYGPQELVRDLVEHYSWVDKLRTISKEELVRRETAYQDILKWTGGRWLEGGIELSGAEPWIKHLGSGERLRRGAPSNEVDKPTIPSGTRQYEPPERQVTPEQAWETYIRTRSIRVASEELRIAPTTLGKLIKSYQSRPPIRRLGTRK